MNSGMDGSNTEYQVTEAVHNVMKALETQIDNELERLEQPDEEELSRLRSSRLREMKDRQSNQRKWIEAGHGEYTELSTEKEFFSVCSTSERVVTHFYRPSTMRCDIVDKHLKLLAVKHIESKFAKINAEKAPFLTQRLNISVIPTILISVGGKVVDRVVGFTSLGGVDDFSTEMLEWRLAQLDGLEYSGDKAVPPNSQQCKKSFTFIPKKTVRGGNKDSSSDED